MCIANILAMLYVVNQYVWMCIGIGIGIWVHMSEEPEGT